MVKIIVEGNVKKPKIGQYLNTLVLGIDNWNDYGYYTSFYAYYCDSKGIPYDIGGVKIYNEKMDWGENDYCHGRPRHDICTYLDLEKEMILSLDDSFCSLGQELEYYRNLKHFLPEEYKNVLKKLRDLTLNNSLQEKFLELKGVKISLLRSASAVKALKEAQEIFKDEVKKHDMSFQYLFKPKYSLNEVGIRFDFKYKNSWYPYRINSVVGKNGTGKTLLLASLAKDISGMANKAAVLENNFLTERPAFYKVMSISYSVFDDFMKSRQNSFCSYVYCGIQAQDNTVHEIREYSEKKINYRPMTKDEIKDVCCDAVARIKDLGRYEDWQRIVAELIGWEQLSLLEQELESKKSHITLSSGQNMVLLSISMVISNIMKESILLIDEPETHLHPNVIASFMRMLNELLEIYDSYAIIATHSPLVLQEVPSNNIVVLDRFDNVLTVRNPSIECFGAGISNICDDIFDVRSNESGYKTILGKAVEKMSEGEILNWFDNNLSLNAMIYLKTICEGEK